MAALTAVASLTVLVPLYWSRRASRPAGEEKLSIFRDQLSEVERDLARGVVAESEAEAARTEISRRLLRASDAAAEDKSKTGEFPRKVVVIVAVLFMPLAALGLYLWLGNPQLPDQPIAERLAAPPEGQDIGVLVARVEAHLAANPEDGQGWELLGPVYVRLGRYDDAVVAFSNSLRLLGSTAEREGDLGEAITRANGDRVTPEARAAFERARALDETAVRPRFYLAVALDQEGRNEEAIVAWRDLLDGAPTNAPWAGVAREALARLDGNPPAMPGPSATDMEAAAALTSEDRMAMIGGMVDSLAARLEADPNDAPGWARLIRSYMVLERTEDAAAALKSAREAFNDDPEKLAVVETEARAVGLTE